MINKLNTERLFALWISSIMLLIVFFVLTNSLLSLTIFTPLVLFYYVRLTKDLKKEVDTLIDSEVIVFDKNTLEFIVSPKINQQSQYSTIKKIKIYAGLNGKMANAHVGDYEIRNSQYSKLRGYIEKFPELKKHICESNMVNRFTYALIKSKYNYLISLRNPDRQYVLDATN